MAGTDKVKNKARKVRGRANEIVGRAFGDRRLERKGRGAQRRADLGDAAEKLKDALRRRGSRRRTTR